MEAGIQGWLLGFMGRGLVHLIKRKPRHPTWSQEKKKSQLEAQAPYLESGKKKKVTA